MNFNEVFPLCNMLIDQNRYIDGDPVGYSCTGKAKYETADGYLICESCKEMMADPKQASRMTFPSQPFTADQQTEFIKNMAKEIYDI